MVELITTIGSALSTIINGLDKALGYQVTALLLAGIILFTLYTTLYNIIKMFLPAPDSQMQKTWDFVYSFGSKKNKTLTDKQIEQEYIKEAQKADKQKYIEMSYRRLGKTMTYEDYRRATGTFQLLFLMLGVLIAIIGMIAFMPLLAIIGLVLGVLGMMFGETLMYKMLDGQIKKLNFREKIELPVLMSRFMAIAVAWKQYPLASVLTTYLPYAEALKCDIELTLADVKSFGDLTGLDLWQARVSQRHTTDMMEFTQFIEKLKKLYSKGDEVYVRNEIAVLQKTVDEKYVLTTIESIGRKRTFQLVGVMLASFACAGGFFIVPKFIEIAQAMSAAF